MWMDLERRLACIAVLVFLASVLSIATPVGSMILLDRAVPSRSMDEIIVVTIALTIAYLLQAAATETSRRYLTATWSAAMVTMSALPLSAGGKDKLGQLNRIVMTGRLFPAFELAAVPVFLALLLAIHWSFIILAVLAALAVALAVELKAPYATAFVMLISGGAALALSSVLIIQGALGFGAFVGASYSVARVLQPVARVVEARRDLASLAATYQLFRDDRRLAGLRTDPSRGATARWYGSVCVWTQAVALVAMAAFLVVPVAEITVLEGHVVPAGETKEVKAPMSAEVDAVLVSDGSPVKAGQTLVRFRSESFASDLVATNDRLADLNRQLVDGRSGFKVRRKLLDEKSAKAIELVHLKLQPEELATDAALAVNMAEDQWQAREGQLLGQIDDAKSRASALERTLRSTTLTAPADGIVQEMAGIAPGSIANPGDSLMKVAPVSSHTIKAALKAADVGNVQSGTLVDIRLRSSKTRYAEAVPGIVQEVSADVDKQGNYVVLIVVGDILPVGAEAEVVAMGAYTSAFSYVVGVTQGVWRRAWR